MHPQWVTTWALHISISDCSKIRVDQPWRRMYSVLMRSTAPVWNPDDTPFKSYVLKVLPLMARRTPKTLDWDNASWMCWGPIVVVRFQCYSWVLSMLCKLERSCKIEGFGRASKSYLRSARLCHPPRSYHNTSLLFLSSRLPVLYSFYNLIHLKHIRTHR